MRNKRPAKRKCPSCGDSTPILSSGILKPHAGNPACEGKKA